MQNRGYATGPLFTSRDGAAIWVEAERKRQDRKWGGREHDAEHTDADWIELLYERLTKLEEAATGDSMDPIRRRAIQLAAVSMAYLEQLHSRTMDKLADSLSKDGLTISDAEGKLFCHTCKRDLSQGHLYCHECGYIFCSLCRTHDRKMHEDVSNG